MFSRSTPEQTASSSPDHATLVTEQAEDTRQLAAALTTLRADIARDEARRTELQTALDAVLTHQRRLESEVRQLSHAYDARTGRREKQMSDLADPRIATLLEWIARERDLLPEKLQTYDVHGPISGLTGRRRTYTTSNHKAIMIVSAALVTARERAEALRYLTVPDVGAALDEIRRTIPTLAEAEAEVVA